MSASLFGRPPAPARRCTFGPPFTLDLGKQGYGIFQQSKSGQAGSRSTVNMGPRASLGDSAERFGGDAVLVVAKFDMSDIAFDRALDNRLWYPSMRLFRQTRLDDWEGFFERVAGELVNMVDGQAQSR